MDSKKKNAKKQGVTRVQATTSGAAIAGTPTRTPAAYGGTSMEKEREPHSGQRPGQPGKGEKASDRKQK